MAYSLGLIQLNLNIVGSYLTPLNKLNKSKKIPKCTCTVRFANKALQVIRLPWIFNLRQVVSQPLDKIKNNDNNPTVTYQLSKTIRNEILNFKEAFNSAYGDEDVSFSLMTDQCDSADSFFFDSHPKHMIT